MSEEENKETPLYHYHPITKEYLGQSIARLDPIEGKPLIPAHASIIPIPSEKLQKDQVLVFGDERWIAESDYRNQRFYKKDGTEIILNKIGEEPKRSWSKDKPEKVASYIDLRTASYPSIGDQLDAILKWFTSERFQGEELPEDLDQVIGQWTAVKKKYPKPKGA